MALNENISGMERFISVVSKNRTLTDRFSGFLNALVLQVNQSIPLDGAGSPEGIITAQPFKTYFDTTADVQYYKKTGAGNTGWVAL